MNTLSRIFVLVVLISFVSFLFPSFSLAQTSRGREATSSARENRAKNLTTGRLRACEAKEAAIKNQTGTLLRRALVLTSNFSSIAERVDHYYTTKISPSGEKIENYDLLKQNIVRYEAAVANAVANAKVSVDNFDCTGEDPKGDLTIFRSDMRNAISLLKEYKISIKDFIVAVRTINSRLNKNSEATPSAREND